MRDAAAKSSASSRPAIGVGLSAAHRIRPIDGGPDDHPALDLRTPFATSEYSGTFEADGSITLEGSAAKTEARNRTTASTEFTAPGTDRRHLHRRRDPKHARRRDPPRRPRGLQPRSLGREIRQRRDLLLHRTRPPTAPGTWCPTASTCPPSPTPARPPSRIPTYEQYAAVDRRVLSDIYGNPYSDASKKVAGRPRPDAREDAAADDPARLPAGVGRWRWLQCSQPARRGPAGALEPASSPSRPPPEVTFKLAKAAKFEHGKLAIGDAHLRRAPAARSRCSCARRTARASSPAWPRRSARRTTPSS